MDEPRTAPNADKQVDEPGRLPAVRRAADDAADVVATTDKSNPADGLADPRPAASRGNGANEAVARGPSAASGAAIHQWKTSRRTRILRKPTSYERIRVSGKHHRTASSAR